MAITLKDTLLDLQLTEDDVEAHEIIQAPTGAERGRPQLRAYSATRAT